MPKYLSGRAKRVPQDQLSEDRYQYLGLDQAEPNLSDPLVSPSVPSGAQYQLVAVPAYPGKRYWVPVGGGLVPVQLQYLMKIVLYHHQVVLLN